MTAEIHDDFFAPRMSRFAPSATTGMSHRAREMIHAGIDVIGKPAGWGQQQRQDWEATNYHQQSDEYSDDWDLGGAIADAQLLFYVGLRAAQQPTMPAWNAGDEFEAARQAAIQTRGAE